jgi:membrane protein DedA with SNARE-associated domain
MHELLSPHLLAYLLETYAYPAVFIFTLLEGETVVAAAGFAAHQGYLRLEYVIMIAILGATIGDQLFFAFGKWKGRVYLERHPEMLARVERARHLLEKYQNLFIFGSRFMYGFRMLIPIALGTTNVTYRKFFFFNLLGAIVWAILFANLGYLFGGVLEAVLGRIKRFEELVLVLILLGGGIASRVYILRKKRAMKDGEEPAGEHPMV